MDKENGAHVVYCCSDAKSCPALSDPMDCSMPDFPVFHCLAVCSNSCPLSQWCHPTISSSVVPFSSCPQSFPTSGSFPMSWLFVSGGQNIGASASASVLPMNILDWYLLGLTSFRIDWFDLLADPKWNSLPPWYPGPRFSMVAYGGGAGGRVWV